MKKVLTFATIFILAPMFSWAEDVSIDPYAVAQPQPIIAQSVDAAEPTTETIAPEIVAAIKTPPVLVTSAPSLSRQDQATLHLSLIRDEVELMKDGGFLGGLFSSGSDLQTTLIQDTDLFFSIFNDLDIASESLLLKGIILKKQGHEKAAALTWLQNIYEFPQSDHANASTKLLNDLLDSDWKKFSNEIRPIIKNIPTTNRAARLSKLISQLYPINDTAFTKALIGLQIDFLKRFPENIHADEVQVLLAHNLGTTSAESAVFGFKKLLALFPNSSYRPEALLAIADLQRLRLKKYDQAVANYLLLIQEHPKHQLAKNSRENLALTYEKHLRDYPAAIRTFSSIVKLYPQDKSALNALQHMAKLQESKTKEHRNAVVSLRLLSSSFKGDEGLKALTTATKIAHKKLKDFALTIEVQEQIMLDYSDTDDAIKAMFKKAELIEKQDPAQAKALFQTFVSTYPKHNLTKKAIKHLQ
ncbi:MAG: tetratricopeptide repeat protein [Ghiorsea sp.]